MKASQSWLPFFVPTQCSGSESSFRAFFGEFLQKPIF